ncbi:MAG: flagellar type III secretion system pore protein FliP [Rhodospirillum sp.]|nr:flagellar type III secretion system pore protein FliP [Rhodospirillum sp.]MCF8490026.1 flagellar type III secretion system pore protein FliP [Rhodospirillum sp.]MCF8499569.1 flagellar type III secretion system pore protein FliP [Rhodospirillum sp.]
MTPMSFPPGGPGRRPLWLMGAMAITVCLGALCLGMVLAIWGAHPALAQSLNLNLGNDPGGDGSTTSRIIQLVGLLTVLSLAPGLLIMVTSFTRVVVVLSILRHALATQTAPPNMVITSLALFITFFIMAPTFEQAWDNGLAPLIAEDITEEEAFPLMVEPFRVFMLAHVRPKDLQLFMTFNNETVAEAKDVSIQALIPAFMISELRRAFEIGFLIFLPFVVIDMVIASVLMSMGMMMLPPMMLAMPFKLIFFVLVDGWYLIVGSLLSSYGGGPGGG